MMRNVLACVLETRVLHLTQIPCHTAAEVESREDRGWASAFIRTPLSQCAREGGSLRALAPPPIIVASWREFPTRGLWWTQSIGTLVNTIWSCQGFLADFLFLYTFLPQMYLEFLVHLSAHRLRTFQHLLGPRSDILLKPKALCIKVKALYTEKVCLNISFCWFCWAT